MDESGTPMRDAASVAASGSAHAHAQGGPPEGTDAWRDWVKDYYRSVEDYDWVAVTDGLKGPEALFHKNRERVVRSLVRRYADATRPMLDAGCGTGLNLRHLPPGSTGLDINPRNVEAIRRRLPQHHVAVGDVEAMPFPDASFGTVVCTEVLEHVPEPQKALAEIRRVLVPGGTLIGSVPARSVIWNLRFLSSTCPRDEPFHHEYKADEVRRMLAGWDMLRLGYSLLHFNVVFVARKPE